MYHLTHQFGHIIRVPIAEAIIRTLAPLEDLVISLEYWKEVAVILKKVSFEHQETNTG